MPAIAASAGIPALTTAERLTSTCRVIAPITTVSPSSVMPARPGTAARSISCDGLARRSFSVGSSVMPPATSLASSSPSRPAASARLVAR
jgi:hypothetical protein